ALFEHAEISPRCKPSIRHRSCFGWTRAPHTGSNEKPRRPEGGKISLPVERPVGDAVRKGPRYRDGRTVFRFFSPGLRLVRNCSRGGTALAPPRATRGGRTPDRGTAGGGRPRRSAVRP